MKSLKIALRFLIALAGAYLGSQLLPNLQNLLVTLGFDAWMNLEGWHGLAVDIAIVVIFGLITFMLAPLLIKGVEKLIQRVFQLLKMMPVEDLIIGSSGMITGLLLANLMGFAFRNLPYIGVSITFFLNIILGFVGLRLALSSKKEILALFSRKNTEPEVSLPKEKQDNKMGGRGKLLDTSVIIDGRIADLCATGFLEGPLVVPLFVLTELQFLSDSADPIKRARGRRGFDVLNRIQKEINYPVIITEKDYENETAVDSKLVKLSQETGYKLLTLDYNLNKMSVLRQVQVLNINDLANALRTIVLPGEILNVTIIKVGRETGQGIAYLDDGTMIVVEGANRQVGKNLDVEVTTSLQTSAGRMIFAKILE